MLKCGIRFRPSITCGFTGALCLNWAPTRSLKNSKQWSIFLDFQSRFLVPLLGPFLGSHFWDRPNQFLLAVPKMGTKKWTQNRNRSFEFWARPDMDTCAAKVRLAATFGCAREQPQAKRSRRATEIKRPLSRSERLVTSLSSLQRRGERIQRSRRPATA